MKLQLLLMGDYPSCVMAQEIWQSACHARGIELEIIELSSHEGTGLAEQLGLKSFPALIKDNQVLAVGNPEAESAGDLLDDLLEADPGSA